MGLVVKPARAVKAAPGEPPLPLASADSATLSVVLAGSLFRLAAPATAVAAALAGRGGGVGAGARTAGAGECGGSLFRLAAPATAVLAALAVRAEWVVSGVLPAEPGESRERVAQEVTQVTAAPSLLVTAERGLGLAAPGAPQAEMPTVAMALLAA